MKRLTLYVCCVVAALFISGIRLKGAKGPGNTWTAASGMASPRAGSCSALLPDGRVLIAGGRAVGGALASAELFLANGSFAIAPDMREARSNHSCATLADGRVLIAGGANNDGALNTAEIYDPAANTWQSAGGMLTARTGHTTSRLPDNRFLVVGGENAGVTLASLEIFNPLTNAFEPAYSVLSSPRSGHTAATLWSGQVLIAGGSDGRNVMATADLFDPERGIVIPAGRLSVPRIGHSATTLLDGKVFIAGGSDGVVDLTSTEVFDPVTANFSPATSMSTPRRGHLALRIPSNNSVLLAGGTAGQVELASAELYIPWLEVFQPTDNLSSTRPGASGSPLKQQGMVVMVGGTRTASSEVYAAVTLMTNKLDYAPGETVIITGAGWRAGETVNLLFHENPLVHPDWSLTAVADASGNIFNNQFVVDASHIGVTFTLTSTGLTSGLTAQTTFTDGNVKVHAAPAGVTFTLTKTVYSGSTNCTSGAGSPAVVNGVDSSGNTTGGVNSGQSMKLQAAATSDQAGAFINWTSTDPFTNLGAGAICVPGFNGGGTRAYHANYAVNAAPAVTAPANQITTEGENHSFTLGSFSDAAGDSPWNVSVNWGDGSPATTFQLAAAGIIPAQSHTYANGPNTYTVSVSVTDKNGGVGSSSGTANFQVSVSNIAPVAALSNNGPVNEGAAATVIFSAQSDPSPTDTTAGFHYAFSCTNGDLSGATYATSGTGASSPCTFNDNGGYTVKARIIDQNGGFSEYTTTVTVNNAPPTAALGNNGPVNEANPATVTVTFTSPTDLSTADTIAGFRYIFSCTNGDLSGSTYAGSGASASTPCSFSDSGSYTVKGRIIDKDNGSTEYTTVVTVNNVAPTATLGNSGPVNEGSAATITFSNPLDPSSVDAASGFHYAYSCTNGSLTGATYANSSASATTSCAFNDNGSLPVKARIIDEDDGFTEYTTVVTVNNVAPTATLGNNGPVAEGSPATISFSAQSDPSSADTSAGFRYAYSCTNGDLSGATYAGSLTTASAACTFSDNGSYTVKGRIIDKDGGFTDYATVVTVNNASPTANLGNNGPVAEGSSATISFSGQADPSSDDVTAGFHYAYSCTNDDLSGANYLGSGTAVTTSCTFNDNGGYTVKARIIDKDNGFSEYQTTVTVTNVAPTATIAGPSAAVDEGGNFSISLNSPFDPSSTDTTAGFTYAFNCSSGYGAFASSSTTSCAAQDNPGVTAKAKIRDKDGGENEYTFAVTINNVAPTAALGNNGPVNEGSPATISFSAQSDPGPVDTTAGLRYAYACDNTSLAGATYAGSGASASTTCTYSDGPSDRIVRGRIIDKDGGYNEYTTSVHVDNVAPTATLSNNGPVNEGNAAVITFSGQADPSSDDTAAGFHYAYSCSNGDLSGATYAGSGTAASTNCPFNDNGNYIVKARIIDKDGGFTDYQSTVVVNNVAPTATFQSPAVAITEGGTFNISLTNPVDVVADIPGLQYAFDCGSGYGPFGVSSTAACVAINNPGQTVKGRIQDKDGGVTGYTAVVAVTNVAPSALLLSLSAASINENGAVTLSGSFTDPGVADVHTLTINWGDGGSTVATVTPTGTRSFSVTHQYLDDGPSPGNNTSADSYTIQVSIADELGSASNSAAVTVTNLAPVVTTGSASIIVPVGPQPVPATLAVAVNVPFTDAGTLDIHTCKIAWDDGASTDGVISGGACAYNGTHTYTAAGVYTVSVIVYDDDKGQAIYAASDLIVVYDPRAGFVTGGGWITSAPGSYVANPALTGKANFGFNSKYEKGKTVPSGQTEFQFKLGNLNFHSTAYEWLVISGAKAQYRGTGTINGSGNYGFLLTATDGSVNGGGGTDQFRIKIWNENPGNVVYDNRLGNADDVDLAEPQDISGGSIVIHKN